MRYLLLLLSCLTLVPLSAAMIGNVEYQLPQQGQGWKIANEFHSHKKIKSTTIIYIPENCTREDTQELFGVHANNLQQTGVVNEAMLAQLMQPLFPGKTIEIHILESSDPSILYEWSAKNHDQEEAQVYAHGWSRAFSTTEGSVILMYQTQQMAALDAARELWLPVLKSAKLHK